MPIWRLTPINLHNPEWQASMYKGEVFVRAADEARARQTAAVTVRVKHTSGRLNVAIHSRDAFGKFVDVAAGSITDPGEQELTLVVEQSVPEGTYTLGLNLPVNAEIISYTIDELP